MKDIALAFLAKTLNMAPESVAELLFKKSDDGTLTEETAENALSELLRLDAERIQKVRPNTQEFFNNGYGKGKSETAIAFEKVLREKFGVDPEGKLQGEALVDAVKAAAAGDGVKPDKVKASTEYLDMERQFRQQIEDIKAQQQAELEQYKQEVNREKTWQQGSGLIKKVIRSMQDINQDSVTDLMIDLLAAKYRTYDLQADGEDFLPIKDGQPLQNAQGYTRRLSELVMEDAAQVFPTQKQPAAGQAGNQNAGPGKAAVNTRFESEEAYFKAYNDAPDLQTKQALYQAWEAQTAQGN